MGEPGASGAVVFGAVAVVLRRRSGVDVLGTGSGEGFGCRGEALQQHGRQFGSGVGCGHSCLL